MLEEVVLRAASLSDMPHLLRIQAASMVAPQWATNHYLEWLRGQEGTAVRRTILLAELRGVPAGFVAVSALCSIAPPEAEVENIAVTPEHRRRGIGRALLDAALAWAVRQGATPVRLEVRASNAQALQLYAAAGFQAVGVRRAYYRDPLEDAVCMVLSGTVDHAPAMWPGEMES